MARNQSSRTAGYMALFRALESTRPAGCRLFADPFAAHFLNPSLRTAVWLSRFSPLRALVNWYTDRRLPGACTSAIARTKLIDEALLAALEAGIRQVVILGAGLDTRAVRKRREGLAFFEIDDKATLDFKEKTYGRHGIKAALALIPANYAKEDWITLLIEQGFDPDLRTHVIWEGNSMYLPIAAVNQTLAAIRDRMPDATLSFDYFASKVADNRTGDPKITALTDYFAQAGAPWVTGIDDIKAFADQQGMQLVETCLVSNLHRRYWPSRIMNVNFLNYYFVCTLATK